jgi:hypothetical protein
MATRKAILAVVARFAGAYPIINRDDAAIKQARLNGYERTFADLEDDVLMAAVEQLVAERDSEYPPSEGQVRNRALAMLDKATGTEPIDEYEAWGIVQRCIGALGFVDTTHEQITAWLTARHAAKGATIAEAIRRIGWRDLCMCDTDDAQIMRAQFRDTVKAIQRREMEDRKTTPAVRSIMQQIAAQMDASRPRVLPAKEGEK